MKAALAGEEVIIASHGKAQVTLVPCASAAGLNRPGALAAASPELLASQVDAAFDAVVDQQVAELFNSWRDARLSDTPSRDQGGATATEARGHRARPRPDSCG